MKNSSHTLLCTLFVQFIYIISYYLTISLKYTVPSCVKYKTTEETLSVLAIMSPIWIMGPVLGQVLNNKATHHLKKYTKASSVDIGVVIQ